MAPKRATRSTPVTTTPAPTATTTTTVTNAQLQAMIDQGVSAVLAARDATRNGIDSHTSGTGVRGSERVARECTYQDFMKCKPLYFKGTKGVVELTQWFERMETVFRISNCSVENQVKFSTCTLLASALTWWNSHVMTVTHDVAYSMTWVDLRKKMTDKYCPRNEMKKLEAELWNLKVIGTDVVKYNQRFQELALLCVRMFPEESDKIERYVGGLPDMIHGNIVASKPKTMQEAIEMATELMDKRVSTMAERQAENKRKFENTSRNNQNQQQQQNKRQNTGRAYTAGSGDKKQYGGSRPLCSKCNYHHEGVWEMPTTLTTRRAPDRVRNLLVLSAEFRGTLRRNVQDGKQQRQSCNQLGMIGLQRRDGLESGAIRQRHCGLAWSSPLDKWSFKLIWYWCCTLARASPYRLAPSEMERVSEQLKELSDKALLDPVPHPGKPDLLSRRKMVIRMALITGNLNKLTVNHHIEGVEKRHSRKQPSGLLRHYEFQVMPFGFTNATCLHQSLHYLKEAKISSQTAMTSKGFGCIDAERKSDFLCITPVEDS
ncbi:putative reverse transcriptase domain-containing protein [Tanacetum coccineum]